MPFSIMIPLYYVVINLIVAGIFAFYPFKHGSKFLKRWVIISVIAQAVYGLVVAAVCAALSLAQLPVTILLAVGAVIIFGAIIVPILTGSKSGGPKNSGQGPRYYD